MAEFFVRITDDLPMMLRAFRKQSGLTQAGVAYRLNITQQMLSKIERNAAAISAARLLRLLSILNVEVVLRDRESNVTSLNGPELPW